MFSTHLSSARGLFIGKEMFQVVGLNSGPGAFSGGGKDCVRKVREKGGSTVKGDRKDESAVSVLVP